MASEGRTSNRVVSDMDDHSKMKVRVSAPVQATVTGIVYDIELYFVSCLT